jgi:hypothetical protein
MNPVSTFYFGGVSGSVISDPKLAFPIIPLYAGLGIVYYREADTIFSKKWIYRRDYSKSFYAELKTSKPLKINLATGLFSGVLHYCLMK